VHPGTTMRKWPTWCTITLYNSFVSIQPWRPGLAGTRAQSCDRYGSGTLHPGQILGGSLPLLSPLYNTFIIIVLYMFRATLCSSSESQIVLIQHLAIDSPVCRLRRNFSTCTPQFILNLHTPVLSQPVQPSSFSTCTPQFLLNLRTPVPSQPAHPSSFSTCTHQFLLNLHTPVPSQPAHPSSFSTCTHQFLLNLHTGRSLTQNTISGAVLIQFHLLMMSTMLFETCRWL